jgi:hypothetical protein
MGERQRRNKRDFAFFGGEGGEKEHHCFRIFPGFDRSSFSREYENEDFRMVKAVSLKNGLGYFWLLVNGKAHNLERYFD